MFEQNDMSEAQTGIVKISDCSSETFKGMLEFCYTGNVSESTMEDLCVDIFAISHKYQITNLKIKCEQFMASTIDKDNFVQYCRIIELYGSSILEEACVKYIVANREEFLKKDEGWKNLKSTFPCLTHRLLEKLIAEIDKWSASW
uniref:BTB domain-containing protein n=1 Tax=Meloidogyne incognita TaxID=6306 RepID=A0A914M7R5_MELIC